MSEKRKEVQEFDEERDPGAGLEESSGNEEAVEMEMTEVADHARGGKPGQGAGQNEFSENIRRILDLQLPVTVSFGTAVRPLAEVLKFSPGSLVELDKSASDPVLLKVNNKVFAWGKVVDVDGYYGVEITEIIARADRIASLGGF